MKTILVADDHRHIREFCRHELEEEGYRVVLACDGREAIRLAHQCAPDAVVLDLCMPRLSGLDAIARLRSVAPRARIILFTAHDEDCLADDRSGHADACVEKSEDLSELKLAIRRAARTDAVPRRGRHGLPADN